MDLSSAFRVLSLLHPRRKITLLHPPDPTITREPRPADRRIHLAQSSRCIHQLLTHVLPGICTGGRRNRQAEVGWSVPVNSRDMSLELEEFDSRESRGTEGGANWEVEDWKKSWSDFDMESRSGGGNRTREVAAMESTEIFRRGHLGNLTEANSISPTFSVFSFGRLPLFM